jgi:DNA-binding MarR family transcriptional regulator
MAVVDHGMATAEALSTPSAYAPRQHSPGNILQQLYALSEQACGAAEREVLRARNLDMRAWLVLRSIGELGSATQRQIAAATGLDKVAVNRAASWLKEQGLAASLPNARDGRSHFLELSLAGEQTLACCAREIAALESELLAGLSETETWDLAKLLRHLHHSLAYRF